MVVILSQKKTTSIVKVLLTVVFFNIELALFTNGCKIFNNLKHAEGYTMLPHIRHLYAKFSFE